MEGERVIESVAGEAESRSKAAIEQETAVLAVKLRPIETLTAATRNPRTHSEEQIARLAESIRRYGWTNPILIDDENGVIAGHGRLLAAQKLGLKTVPCIELSGLDEQKRREYLLADNRLAENAGWDLSLLKIELEELKELGADLNMIGFGAEDWQRLFGADAQPPEDFDEYDENLDTTYHCPKCGYKWSGKPK